MTATAALNRTTTPSRGTVGEFITEDRVEALNRGLAEHGVEGRQVIAIFLVPAQPVANAAPARLRVLYRKD
jgi:hypothetical protein